MTYPRLSAALLGAAMLLSNAPCRAGTLVLTNMTSDDGLVTSLLEATSQRYVDAMRGIVHERHPGDHSARDWEHLEQHIRRARVARFEYRYPSGNGISTRVYHAMDGESLGTVADEALGGHVTARVPHGDSDDAWSDDDEPMVTTDEAAQVQADLEDARYFTGFDEHDVRAVIPRSGDSSLFGMQIDGRDRRLDAEFKAMRAIEDDLAKGVVPAGGEVTGMVGGGVCASCRYAAETLARTRGIDIRITQMFGSLHPAERKALIEAGKATLRGTRLLNAATGRPWFATDVLAGSRELQVKRALNPVAVERGRQGIRTLERRFRLGPLVPPGDDAPPIPPEC
jgi:hypothetical protein